MVAVHTKRQCPVPDVCLMSLRARQRRAWQWFGRLTTPSGCGVSPLLQIASSAVASSQ